MFGFKTLIYDQMLHKLYEKKMIIIHYMYYKLIDIHIYIYILIYYKVKLKIVLEISFLV